MFMYMYESDANEHVRACIRAWARVHARAWVRACACAGSRARALTACVLRARMRARRVCLSSGGKHKVIHADMSMHTRASA